MSARSLNVLVVDDERELCTSLAGTLRSMGHKPVLAESAEAGLKLLERIDLVLLDVNLPGMTGLGMLREIRAFDPSISVLIITAHGNIRDAVEAMREGAYNYIEKPVREADLEELIGQAQEARALVMKSSLSSPTLVLDGERQLVSGSRQMRPIFELIQRLGQVNTNVLIRGENGTGKELVARAIHFNSPRKEKPFVAVNCGAIPESLAESAFFGHERGAFTGADQRQIGHFQYAEGGTLFLDEIGEISQAMQVKLLRVLQERKFTPIGSNREIRCDVRIIAATNRDLEALVRSGQFRQDLFYRLNVMPIELPPLRDRVEDIPLLVEHFIHKFNSLHDRGESAIRGVSDEAIAALRAHSWPGNIRELENTIERAFVLESGHLITAASLSELARSRRAEAPTHAEGVDFHGEKDQFEREFILSALRRSGGRINQTVAQSGIPKNTLLRKIRKYGINPAELKI
ncbi:MAG TPA: sigma-54 dependent transcriptional regulator [Bdellovibrionota bacterium]|nr:sigma-54 dependent transcriptional regulator [Bdellovibrionota bacterium]